MALAGKAIAGDIALRRTSWSGRADLNRRPHGPEPCALAGLSHAPIRSYACARLYHARYYFARNTPIGICDKRRGKAIPNAPPAGSASASFWAVCLSSRQACLIAAYPCHTMTPPKKSNHICPVVIRMSGCAALKSRNRGTLGPITKLTSRCGAYSSSPIGAASPT